MRIIETVSTLRAELVKEREMDKKIGFVPTMGALHEGHLSLVKKSKADNEVTVVSIFVNPTQFNDSNDFDKYPRTLEEDCKLLEKAGVSFVFVPTVKEMYPEPDTRIFNFSPLDLVMEGKFRPGHFNGVAQVVSKLFDVVNPDRAYFGKKDFQQLAIIREMVKQLNYPIEIVGCPIVREEGGLAMSSRNMRLSEKEREIALKISQTLFKSATFAATYSVEQIKAFVKEEIAGEPGLLLEYFEIVDGNTLQSICKWDETMYPVGCITVFCGDVRLIDNIEYSIN